MRGSIWDYRRGQGKLQEGTHGDLCKFLRIQLMSSCLIKQDSNLPWKYHLQTEGCPGVSHSFRGLSSPTALPWLQVVFLVSSPDQNQTLTPCHVFFSSHQSHLAAKEIFVWLGNATSVSWRLPVRLHGNKASNFQWGRAPLLQETNSSCAIIKENS